MATNNGDRLEFFMPYLPYPSELMLLPLSFSRHLPRPLPETVMIKNSSGNLWRVRMRRKKEHACFASGWATFGRDNNLKAGEFMVFEYRAPRTFHVNIFGVSSCREKRARVEVQEISEETMEEDMIDVGDSSGIYSLQIEEGISDEEVLMETPTTPGKITKFRASGKNGKTSLSWRRGPFVENPETYLDDPSNPFFVTELKKRTFELLVPAQTVRDYNLSFFEYVSFIDGVEVEKLEGKHTTWKDQRACINQWGSVCRRNKIKPEDKIICELLRDHGTVHAIKVHVIRG